MDADRLPNRLDRRTAYGPIPPVTAYRQQRMEIDGCPKPDSVANGPVSSRFAEGKTTDSSPARLTMRGRAPLESS